MRSAPPRPRSRFAVLATALALTASLLVGVGTAAAGTTKWSVCHFDRTSGTYITITVATKSAHPNLARGDYLAETRLTGKTVYAIAYTEADGVAGYSACDALIAALYEDGGDGVPSAGDKILLARYPTAFTAPFGFTAFTSSGVTVASVTDCNSTSVGVDLGGGLQAGWGSNAGGIFALGDLTDPDLANAVVLQDNVGGGVVADFTDRIIVNGAFTTKAHEGNNPWVDVNVSGVCNS